MAAADGDDSLYPIAVLIDELRNEDVQVPAASGPLRPHRRPPSARRSITRRVSLPQRGSGHERRCLIGRRRPSLE